MSSPAHLEMLARLASVCGEWNSKLTELSGQLDGNLAAAVTRAAELLSDVDEVLSNAYVAERKKFPPSSVRSLPVSREAERGACDVLGKDRAAQADGRYNLRRRPDGYYMVCWERDGKRQAKLFGRDPIEARRRHAEWLAEQEGVETPDVATEPAEPTEPTLFGLVGAGVEGDSR